MKEFLVYLHTELGRMASLHESSEKISKEDTELLDALRGAAITLGSFAESIKDGKLYQIADDFEYSIYHMRVTFKARAALDEAQTRINDYQQ